ncbi:MAG: type II toxin-antitoxin system HicA family toxin [Christensenellales bacterium]|jgi:predicted RNA binding protein YcfA (HicA-like mRNA interferase family)
MKRRDLIKLLEGAGWKLDRTGGPHDVYHKPGAPRPIPVKRQREIPDIIAQGILKQAGLKKD